MTQLTPGIDTPIRHAALDSAHVGDIRGALGTIAHHDTGARDSWRARLRTFPSFVERTDRVRLPDIPDARRRR